jgi:GxxExxY protein
MKSAESLHPVDVAQTICYLKTTGLSVAALINFGQQRLEFRRVVYDSKRHKLISEPLG